VTNAGLFSLTVNDKEKCLIRPTTFGKSYKNLSGVDNIAIKLKRPG